MNTALDRLRSAIADDVSGDRSILNFTFSYADFVFEYMGRYYAYVHPVGDSRARVSDEYCWNGYDELLSAMISQTGKHVWEMLAALPEHDLEIEFDVQLPHGAIQADP